MQRNNGARLVLSRFGNCLADPVPMGSHEGSLICTLPYAFNTTTDSIDGSLSCVLQLGALVSTATRMGRTDMSVGTRCYRSDVRGQNTILQTILQFASEV